MDRRSLLASTTGLLTASWAGCLRLSAQDTGTATPSGDGTPSPGETPTRTGRETEAGTESETEAGTESESDIQLSGAVPEWASWFPASTLDGTETDLFTIDTDRAREAFPRDELDLLPTGTHGDFQAQKRTVSVHHADGSYAAPKMYRGSFEREAILDDWEVEESDTTTYRGFTILLDNIGFTESVYLQNEPYACLDAKYGETASLGTVDPDWETLLSATAGHTMLVAGKGDILDLPDGLPGEVQATARTVDSIDQSTAAMRVYALFDSEETAQQVHESHRDEIVEAGKSYEEESRGTSQTGRLVVASYESSRYYYDWTIRG